MTENELFGISEQLNDTISRAAVVDEIEGVDWYHINKNGEMVHGANDAEHQAWYKADDIYAAIERVSSAQPVAKDINVPVKDSISRQAAIDALGEEPLVWHEDDAGEVAERNQWRRDVAAIKALPSAQQESKYEYHYDHTDCIWYRPEARNRCPSTCAQYRDGWNDAMNYIFRDGEGYRPFRRDKKYEG